MFCLSVALNIALTAGAGREGVAAEGEGAGVGVGKEDVGDGVVEDVEVAAVEVAALGAGAKLQLPPSLPLPPLGAVSAEEPPDYADSLPAVSTAVTL